MDKSFLLRLNNSYKQIKTRLLLNDKIRTYLVYDEINDDTPAPSIELASQHIFLQPVIDVDSAEPFDKKYYITITIPSGEASNTEIDYTVRVIVMCEKHGWMVNNNIRPLIIAQEIINELDDLKLEFADPLSFYSIVETVTNKDTTGYSLLFQTTDGVGSNDSK